MKKFLLFFISILSFSLLIVNNKTYAQYPNFIKKTTYYSFTLEQENEYTYEFTVWYRAYDILIETIAENEYYLISDIDVIDPVYHIFHFHKGINRDTNSYELENVVVVPAFNYTAIKLRITVIKSLVYDYYNMPDDENMYLLFEQDTALYISYDENLLNLYDSGYQDGYKEGYQDGFTHDNRIKVTLWEYNNIQYIGGLSTVYKYRFIDFVPTYSIVSLQSHTMAQVKNKVFIPTFEGFVSTVDADVRQWYLGTQYLYISIERPLINTIMTRDNVNEIIALKTYLEENNIYGYFERMDGKTKYQLGYDDGRDDGYNEGYDVGYDIGYDNGYIDGNQDGYFWGHEEGYDEGYNIGYDLGFDVGYIAGDENGYNRGYEEGVAVSFDVGHEAGWNEAMDTVLVKFTDRIHIWLIPAIILVFIIGVFIAYRRRQE